MTAVKGRHVLNRRIGIRQLESTCRARLSARVGVQFIRKRPLRCVNFDAAAEASRGFRLVFYTGRFMITS